MENVETIWWTLSTPWFPIPGRLLPAWASRTMNHSWFGSTISFRHSGRAAIKLTLRAFPREVLAA